LARFTFGKERVTAPLRRLRRHLAPPEPVEGPAVGGRGRYELRSLPTPSAAGEMPERSGGRGGPARVTAPSVGSADTSLPPNWSRGPAVGGRGRCELDAAYPWLLKEARTTALSRRLRRRGRCRSEAEAEGAWRSALRPPLERLGLSDPADDLLSGLSENTRRSAPGIWTVIPRAGLIGMQVTSAGIDGTSPSRRGVEPCRLRPPLLNDRGDWCLPLAVLTPPAPPRASATLGRTANRASRLRGTSLTLRPSPRR
jgi:hypothetical protein